MVIALLLCIGGIVAMWWFKPHQPIARLSLRDGTVLRLEYATYGTKHKVPGSGRFIAWASHFAERWPSLGITPRAANYTVSSDETALVLWFTTYDPRTRQYVDPVELMEIKLIEDGPNGRSEGGSDIKSDYPTPLMYSKIGVFDRRKADLRFRITTMEGQVSDMVVPNPAAKIRFPEWQPEALPQTRHVAGLDLVLRSLKMSSDGVGFCGGLRPELEILDHGQKAAGLGWSFSTLVDATGNSSSDRLLPLTESAWKLQTKVWRTDDYPFTEREGSTLGPVAMPGPGNYVILKTAERDSVLPFAALFGPGHYRRQEGAFVRVGGVAEGEEEVIFGDSERAPTVELNLKAPALVFFSREGVYGYHEEKRKEAPLNVVRIKSAGRDQRVNLAKLKVFGSIEAEVYHFSSTGDRDAAGRPSPGTPVTVQLVSNKPEIVEFLIAPSSIAPKEDLSPKENPSKDIPPPASLPPRST